MIIIFHFSNEWKNNMAFISVVIPTFNRAEMLCACVDSVLAGEGADLEVIVVDDASTDNTPEVFTARYAGEPRVRLLRNAGNVLAAQTRNNGLAVARGEYVMFLDNDNVVARDMMARLAAVLDADEKIGLVGALSVQKRTGTIWTLGAGYDFWTSRPVNAREGERLEAVNPVGLHATMYAPNAFMVRRRVAEAVGGFDARYGIMYEEADFGYRVNAAGFRAVICAEARTEHLGFVAREDAPPLRHLGIESPLRTHCFARNRTWFMRRWAPWRCLAGYYLFFIHLFTLYYCYKALRHGRPEIARAYFTGMLAGVFSRQG